MKSYRRLHENILLKPACGMVTSVINQKDQRIQFHRLGIENNICKKSAVTEYLKLERFMRLCI